MACPLPNPVIEKVLHKIDFEKSLGESSSPHDPSSQDQETVDGQDGFLDELFADRISFDNAEKMFVEIKKRYLDKHPDFSLTPWEPFAPFHSLRAISEIIAEINKRFSGHENMSFLDSVPFSDCIANAISQAVMEKEASFKVVENIEFDPVYRTDKATMVSIYRDFFYNSVDAGADRIDIASLPPSREENSDRFNRLPFEDYPVHYIRIRDNGRAMKSDKAAAINGFLRGKSVDEGALSSKEKGGLGTKNLRDFLVLHKGFCEYEPADDGTVIHLFFEKLNI